MGISILEICGNILLYFGMRNLIVENTEGIHYNL